MMVGTVKYNDENTFQVFYFFAKGSPGAIFKRFLKNVSPKCARVIERIREKKLRKQPLIRLLWELGAWDNQMEILMEISIYVVRVWDFPST